MGYAVRMPQLGMTMEEGVVVEWLFDVGEPFDEGDVIAVVESEKTQNDVEARTDGQYVEQFVEPNENVGPGDPIAYVDDEGEEVPTAIREEGESAGGDDTTESSEAGTATDNEAPGAAATAGSGGDETSAPRVSPRARSFAENAEGVDQAELGTLDGTGPDGAVVEADVERAVEAGTLGGTAASKSAADTATAPTTGGEGRTVSSSVSVDGRGIYERREGSRLRNAVADRMTQSAREAPQVTLNRAVPVGALLDLKERLAADRELDLSLSDFLLAAVADALESYPAFNALYRDGVHELAGNVNVGLAVDAEDGLLTPVVKGAGQRSLTDLAAERSRVVERVLDGEHTHDDLSEGTFTITNLGHFGVDTFDPIVNPPQVAILGVGRLRDSYDPETGESRPELNLSLTFDHRPVDGADGARFLDAVAEGLTHPLRLLTLAGDVGVPTQDGATDDDAASAAFRELDESTTDARAATAESVEGMHATVRSRTFEWSVDEPEDAGGEDTAPNPVEQFLGSLSACLSLMIRTMAERREVAVESVAVSVDASPEHGSIERIDVRVDVVSSASEDDVVQVVEMAERACYVNRALADDLERSIDVHVESP